LFTVIVGLALMLTVATAEFVQELLLEPITVYEVLLVGETINGFEVEPVLQV
jgi:hypothetical protein